MPLPFGGHPKLSDFLEFVKSKGFSIRETTKRSEKGRSYRELVITGKSGARLIIVNPDLDERLAPHTVANYQRRLGVSTPYAATPEAPSDVEYVEEK